MSDMPTNITKGLTQKALDHIKTHKKTYSISSNKFSTNNLYMSGPDIQRRRLVCEALAVELCKRLGITLDSIRAKTKTSKADARINGLRRKVILAMHKLGYTTVDIGFALHRDHKSIHFYIHGRTGRRGSTQELKLDAAGKSNGELGAGAGCSPDGHT